MQAADLAGRARGAGGKAIGDDGTAQRVIRTAFGRGYQFVAPLTQLDSEADATRPRPSLHDVGSPAERPDGPVGGQDIRFCATGDGTRIAYSTVGNGPPLVKAANWMTYLEFERESPIWSHWIDGLSRHRALLRYDERGCGLSDWDVDRWVFDVWVEELEVVVEHAGLERFTLLGVSQGAAVAVAFAVRHPERVQRLVLYG